MNTKTPVRPMGSMQAFYYTLDISVSAGWMYYTIRWIKIGQMSPLKAEQVVLRTYTSNCVHISFAMAVNVLLLQLRWGQMDSRETDS